MENLLGEAVLRLRAGRVGEILAGMTLPKSTWNVAAALALAALVFGAFGGALACGFVRFDDHGYVYQNPQVVNGLTVDGIRWAFTTVWQQWWLPFLWISYMADTSWWGTGPWGYHLTNLLLHAANAGLLFWVCFRLTGARGRSLAVAALWAVHPLRVESVVWVTERKDVLSGLFFFLALLAYERYARRPGWRRMGLVFAAMLSGLMSKGTVVVLPALLLLLDYWPLRRAQLPWAPGEGRRWGRLIGEKAVLFGLSAIFATINFHTHVGGSGTMPWTQRLGLLATNLWIYLRLTFWPVRLSFFYPEHDEVAMGAALAALAGLAALLAGLVWLGRRKPYLLVGGLWFPVALLPVIRGVRLGLAGYADRFTYLPSIGLILALVWAAGEVWERCGVRPGPAPDRPARHLWRTVLPAALVAGLVASMALATRRQTQTWRDSETLFRHALAVTENNAVAHANLATCLKEQGRRAEAREHLEAVLAIKPQRADSLNNLAWMLATDPDAAPEQAARALDLARQAVRNAGTPSAAMLDTLGVAQAACGDYAQAARTAERARILALGKRNVELADEIEERLRLYRAGKPYRP